MPRPSSPLNAKASVRSPYALDRSQQNSCVGTEVVRPRYEAREDAHTCALICLCQTMMSSRVHPPSSRGSRINPSIHDVIRRHVSGRRSGNSLLSAIAREWWWSQTGSNRRPHACKARALPTELWPHHQQWWARVDSNYRPHAYQACALTT